ncbi:DoxX family protein [Limibacter armeniacum]|uniref:DoxX family protein n=1 Tax=Limibacter armeniacum TaxID=466084 RepID=UPI002FE677AC
MKKRNKITYWSVTGLFCAMMLMSASMYVFKYEEIAVNFAALGYPVYLLYPLAAAKALGAITILTKPSNFLKNLAYAGFFYNFVMAFGAHIMAGDGEFEGALVAFLLLGTSYFFDRKVFGTSSELKIVHEQVEA